MLLYPLILLLPGYVIGWYTNVLSFRNRLLPTRVLLGTVVGAAVCPALTNVAMRVGGFTLVWMLYGVVGLAFVATLRMGRLSRHGFVWDRWIASGAVFALAWCASVLCCVIDVQVGENLFHPHISGYGTFVPVVDAVLRTGVPPADPLFYDGVGLSLAYHYFLYQESALVAGLSNGVIDVRSAALGGAVWAGFCLVAAAAVFVRFFDDGRYGTTRARRRSLVAVCLLAVAGLDLIPIFGEFLSYLATGAGNFYGGEFWNYEGAVQSWHLVNMASPHNVMGAAIVAAGLLFCREAIRAPDASGKLWSAMLAAAALASAAGTAILVWLVAGASLMAYAIVAAIRRKPGAASLIAAIGVGSLIAAAPYLADLVAAALADDAGGAQPFALVVRQFGPANALLDHFGVESRFGRELAHLVCLPLNYLLELGVFLLLGLVYARRFVNSRQPEHVVMLAVVICTSFLIASFVETDLRYHDLTWRSIMLAQFGLLVWSVEVIDAAWEKVLADGRPSSSLVSNMWRGSRRWVSLALALGLLAPVHNALCVRFVPVIAMHDPIDHGGTQRALSSRRLYEQLRATADSSAVIVYNPAPTRLIGYQPGISNNTTAASVNLYVHRQLATTPDSRAGSLLGLTEVRAAEMSKRIGPVFAAASSVDTVGAICSDFGISHVIVTHADSAWHLDESWVHRAEPVLATDFARVFQFH